MVASIDRNRRAIRVAAAILAGLIILVILANLLWPGPPAPPAAQSRMPPTQSPFPTSPMGPTLHAVRIDANSNLSMRLLMTSLQGLVNRASVELYLDVPGVAGNTSRMLTYLASRYNLTYDVMSAQSATDAYVRVAAGLIVYDPTRPESIDIGTVMAAQKHAVLVGPDLAGSLAARYGLPVLFDYARRGDWTALDPIAAYDRALRDLYPSSYPYLLAILPPDRWAIRDYLVQTRTFVFYHTQGILASPSETAATMRIPQAPPRGIPILGWFNSPTLTEENSFTQMASAAGKLVAGGRDGPTRRYVNFTKRYLDAADMDVVWLLNAFAASEIPYSAGSLSTYVDGLRPGGIVLDYDDQPRTRDAWIQAGTQAIAPVVRSTHFWTTADNVLGKLDTSLVARGAPNFLWLTVYTFRFDLEDARALADELSRRMGGDLEIVTPTQFFGLLRAHFVRTAHTRLAATDGDPVASLLFPGLMDSARSHLRDADASVAGGDADRVAYAAYLGLEDLRSISASEALLTSLLVILAAAVLAYFAHRSSRSAPHSPERLRLGVLLVVTASVALLVFALREALDQNFWTYPTILAGVVAAGIHGPLRNWLDRAYPDRAPTAAALLALVFATLAIRTSAAFPLAMIGILLAIDAYLARRPSSSSEVLLGLAFGTAKIGRAHV